MSQYKIVACDLDGTLLDGEKNISKENWDAIRRITEAGAWFVPSSGRSLGDMPRELIESPYVRFLIHSDGAAVYDKETGKSIRFSLSREQSDLLMDIVLEYDTVWIVLHDGHTVMDGATESHEYYRYHNMSREWIDFSDDHYEHIDGFYEYCRSVDGIDMLCPFFHSPAEREECAARLRALGFTVATSDPHNLEIYDPRAGKGNALRHLAEMLEVDMSQTIGVGDSPNDSEMVRAAGLGLAVGNAYEELKRIADAVICRNDEHVIRYIWEQYFEN